MGNVIYAKRLSPNDTGATKSHQSGLYLSKSIAFRLCPELDTSEEQNPRRKWLAESSQTGVVHEISLIYYNSGRVHPSTKSGRNECRLTGWGGAGWGRAFSPESTGSIMICSFNAAEHKVCVWIGATPSENALLESSLGGIGPSEEFSFEVGAAPLNPPNSVSKLVYSAPKEWFKQLPSGIQIADFVCSSIRPETGESVDKLLLRRMEEEYALFAQLESAIYEPMAKNGFSSIDAFLSVARSLLNSRMSRAGRSLELCIRQALVEANVRHSWQPNLLEATTPDFIFPSVRAYLASPDGAGLTHLASKRTLRDRWRGVLQEARKVPLKHLLTLDSNLTIPQTLEIAEAQVVLVIPEPLMSKIPNAPGVVPKCISVADFIASVQ